LTPISSEPEFEESVRHDHSSETSSWELDVSVGAIFKNLSVNMVLPVTWKMKIYMKLKK